MTTNIESFNLTASAHDAVASSPHGDLSTEKLDAVNRDHADNEVNFDAVSKRVKLITEQRVHDEKLDWLRPIHDGDNLSYGPIESEVDLYGGNGKIVDADGVVYDAILRENGTVDEGWWVFDSADTFEHFSRATGQQLVEVAEMWIGRHHYSLCQDKQTEELFSHSYHPQVIPSDFVSSVNTVPHLASRLFDLHEQQTVVFPQTGHIAISLPVDLVNQVERLAHLEDHTMRDWIVERLSECTKDERSTATLAAEEERKKRIRSWIESKPPSSGENRREDSASIKTDREQVEDIIDRIRSQRVER